MSRYNFKCLSSQDFEELTRDLLQAEWRVALEAFKSGRDSGIDLRYAHINGGKTIVQCKHYAVSGFGKLFAHLRDCERPKIEQLSPARYVVVTSVELTPGNKDQIVCALRPFVVSASDIFGAADLEGLLSKHPHIERANFKLWLTSTSVIERVLHNAEVCQTEFELERIGRKLPLFVQSDAFSHAMQLLDHARVVVISGVPGIGKTTLAEMLLYAHLEQGYEPVVIQAEIAEGKRFFKANTRQIFYYDDFLGQIFLGDRSEYLGRNQDMAIVDFMELVSRSPDARFVLTTREHILQSALQISERLARSRVMEHRCVLELGDYSYAHKARILYNHLYFSDLPQAYKDAVLEDDFFLKIIDHQHFNPRLIEWLSTNVRKHQIGANEYRRYISKLLQSPNDIWTHAFRNQISNAARHLLLGFYTLGDWTNVVDLEPVFTSLYRFRATKYNWSIAPEDFHNALQELDGAFLSYRSERARYLNPSIGEFVASLVAGKRDTAEDLLVSAIRFKQIAKLWRLSLALPNCELAAFLRANRDLLTRALSRLLHGPSTCWEKTPDGLRGYPIDMGMEARIGFLVEVAASEKSPALCALASQASELLVASWDSRVPYFVGVRRLLREIAGNRWFLAHGGRVVYRYLLDGVLNHLSFASAFDWLELLAFPEGALEWTEADQFKLDSEVNEYCKIGVKDDRRNCMTVDEMNELIGSLSELGSKVAIDLSSEIDCLNEAIAEREEARSALSERSGIPGDPVFSLQAAVVSDEDVRQMFRTLGAGE
jgi:hypothetical protein